MAFLTGPTFIFEQVNAQYVALMGHRELTNKAIDDALPELSEKPFKTLMAQVMRTGIPYVASEMGVRILCGADNKPRDGFYDFAYHRVDDIRGRPYGIFVRAVDVTARVIERRAKEQLADELSEAVRARDQFLCIASHEFKTPITSLKMQLQMLERGVDPDNNRVLPTAKLAQKIALCCRQVDRLTGLVEALLDAWRAAYGEMELSFGMFDLSQLVVQVLQRFAEQLQDAGCRLEVRCSDEVWVHCDGLRIGQVVASLVSNAIKYGAHSAVCIETSALNGRGGRLCVRDGGIGIAGDKQAKIFDRFQRAVPHDNVSGLGLGLYMSKQIVEAHHGTIAVRSCLGQGATFTVELPKQATGGGPIDGAHVK